MNHCVEALGALRQQFSEWNANTKRESVRSIFMVCIPPYSPMTKTSCSPLNRSYLRYFMKIEDSREKLTVFLHVVFIDFTDEKKHPRETHYSRNSNSSNNTCICGAARQTRQFEPCKSKIWKRLASHR